MGKVMKSSDFVAKAKDIANNYKTLYVMGCFGAPMTTANKKRYINDYPYNKQASRQKMINKASSDTFGFDCVCLIKGILWGWNGNKNRVYGGATYCSNGVPDFGTENMLKYCTGVSSDFKKIEVGEVLYMKGHAGIYIGNGLVVESTPAWKNKVQITKLSQRKWLKHGKLKYIDYTVKQTETPTEKPTVNEKPATVYYKKYTGKSGSIVDALKSIGVNSSFINRSKVARANGIKLYLGKYSQNIKLLNLLKKGKLIKAK